MTDHFQMVSQSLGQNDLMFKENLSSEILKNYF